LDLVEAVMGPSAFTKATARQEVGWPATVGLPVFISLSPLLLLMLL
jgi:hypothetical protein